MANERRATDRFIIEKLLADTALKALVTTPATTTTPETYRVYQDSVVPQSAVMPFVSFGALSFIDRNALPAYISIFSLVVYWVRAVVEGRDLTIGYQLQNRIDEALRGQFGTVVLGSETYYIGPWFRRAVRQLPVETEGTKNYTTLGVELESRVQKL